MLAEDLSWLYAMCSLWVKLLDLRWQSAHAYTSLIWHCMALSSYWSDCNTCGFSLVITGNRSGPPYSARRFGGASALEDDRAGRRVAVDEHGIARRASDDIWSAATSR